MFDDRRKEKYCQIGHFDSLDKLYPKKQICIYTTHKYFL